MLAEDVIALRELEFSGKTPSRVTVALNPPFQVDNSWKCEFVIRGLQREVAFYAMGVDSMQALVLALQNIASFLYTSEEFNGGQLSWLGQRDLGFPTVKAIADLIPD